MLRLRPLLLAPLAALFFAAQSHAAVMFTADITPGQENPPTASTAFGFATFLLNDAMTQLTFEGFINGIDVNGLQTPATALDNLNNAHIHAQAIGVNGPVVWGFIGAPFNDNNPSDFVLTPFATGVGATFSGKWDAPEGQNTTLTAQLNNLLSGNTYINFHTQRFGGGEIRGQILTPEPTSMILLGTGLLGLATRRRWLKK